jgi:DNA-binding XRE family transcriptional regulator
MELIKTVKTETFSIPNTFPTEMAKRWITSRIEKNLLIVDLAKTAELSEAAISRIENGHTTKVNIGTVKIISQILQKPIWYIGCYDQLQEDSFAHKIKKARLYCGMTKKEASIYMEVNDRTFRSWEKETCQPDKKNQVKLQNFIEIVHKKFIATSL